MLFRHTIAALMVIFFLAGLPIRPVEAASIDFYESMIQLAESRDYPPTLRSMDPDTLVSAEHLLNSLARDKKSQRTIGGAVALGGSALMLALSAGSSSGYGFEDLGRSLGLILGGAFAVTGVVLLAVPSRTENEATEVGEITNQQERERAAYASLVSLADRAQEQRLIGGALSIGLGVSSLLASKDSEYQDDTFSILLIGEGIYYLLSRSPEKKALDRYEDARRSPGLGMVILPALQYSKYHSYTGLSLRVTLERRRN